MSWLATFIVFVLSVFNPQLLYPLEALNLHKVIDLFDQSSTMDTSIKRFHNAMNGIGMQNATGLFPDAALRVDIEMARGSLNAGNAGRARDTPVANEQAQDELVQATLRPVSKIWAAALPFFRDAPLALQYRKLVVQLMVEAVLYKTRIKSVYANVLNDLGYDAMLKKVEAALAVGAGQPQAAFPAVPAAPAQPAPLFPPAPSVPPAPSAPPAPGPAQGNGSNGTNGVGRRRRSGGNSSYKQRIRDQIANYTVTVREAVGSPVMTVATWVSFLGSLHVKRTFWILSTLAAAGWSTYEFVVRMSNMALAGFASANFTVAASLVYFTETAETLAIALVSTIITVICLAVAYYKFTNFEAEAEEVDDDVGHIMLPQPFYPPQLGLGDNQLGRQTLGQLHAPMHSQLQQFGAGGQAGHWLPPPAFAGQQAPGGIPDAGVPGIPGGMAPWQPPALDAGGDADMALGDGGTGGQTDAEWWMPGSQAPVPSTLAMALTPSATGAYSGAMPAGHRPAGPELLAAMFAGQVTPSVKAWWNSIWPANTPRGQIFNDGYAMADVCDSEVDRILSAMTDPSDGGDFARRVAQNKTLEVNLRHLDAQISYNTNQDAGVADYIRLSKPPGADITPSWLQAQARDYSQAVYKQQQRVRSFKPSAASGGGASASSSQSQAPAAKPTARARGRGRGGGRGGAAKAAAGKPQA